MNERIQELKNQCWVEKHWDKENERWIDRHVDLEKFAELIVKECAESLWDEECYNSDLALEEFEKNSKKIKQHFGVE